MKKISNVLKGKIISAIADFCLDHPNELIHDCCFHHYGHDYRIIETEEGICKIFRHCKYDICDTYICSYLLNSEEGEFVC